MSFSPEGLARASSRHPWRTILAWVLVVATMGWVSGALLAGVLTTDIAFTNDPEAVRAQDLLEKEFTGVQEDTEFLIVRSASSGVDDRPFEKYVKELSDEADGLGAKVVSGDVTNVYEIDDQIDGLVLPNRNGVFVPLAIKTDAEGANIRFRAALDSIEAPGRFDAELVRPQELLSRPIGRAADGAAKLADGVGQAADGSSQITTGLRQLSAGASALADGVGDAAGGAGLLADNLGAAQDGARGLANGTEQLADGSASLAEGLGSLADATGELREGVRDLGNDAREASNDADRAANGASDARADANELAHRAGDIEQALHDLASSNPGLASDSAYQRALDDAQQAQNEASDIAGRLDGVADDARAAANGASGVADGVSQIGGGLGELRGGVRQTAGGAKQIARGADRLGNGTEQLADGLGQASDGASQLAKGIGSAEAGARGLGDGAAGLADGASGLREGLGALSKGNRALAKGLDEGSDSMKDMELGGTDADVRTMMVILKSKKDRPLQDPAFHTFTDDAVNALASASGGALDESPVNYFDVKDRSDGLVSDDEHATLIPIEVANGDAATVEALRRVAEENGHDGFEVLLAGPATLQQDTTEIAEQDLRTGESLGLLVALAVLIGVFAALLAALLPVGVAMAAIPVALGLTALLGQIFEFNLFTQNMISMIGLAVGIDYSLFIVARYREERRRGEEKRDAIERTGGTASRAVLFSGLTVVLALLGMFIIPTTIFRSMATGAMLVVLASIAASLTLLPAVLALLGDRINWPRITKRAKQTGDPDSKGGFWDRVTRGVMRRPVVALAASVLLLGGLGSFYFTIQKGTSENASSLPDAVQSKKAFELLSSDFSGGKTDPVYILVEGSPSDVQAPVARLRDAIAADPAFDDETTVTPAKSGETVLVTALFKGDAFTNTAFDGIERLRGEIVPEAFRGTNTEVLVGGSSAFFTDFMHVANDYQPIVLLFVLGLSFVLLMTVFRSIVVPLKAVLMNLLSVGAAYGALVLVFQHGVGIGLFNAIGFKFQKVEAIEAWLPLMLFSILFGLSMDYHVFLLSRIKERYDLTGDNDEAVAFGLRTTAGIITGAALIMVAVFAAFAAGSLAMLQQMGFGLAVAVFMDATVVRSVLVPASMKLLGKVNWYLPKWLEWLPRLDVEGHEAARRRDEAEAETGGDVFEEPEPERVPA